MVTGALAPDSPIAEHVRTHGDGIRDICFLVDDVAGRLRRRARPGRRRRCASRPRTRTPHGVDPPRRHPRLRRHRAHLPRPIGLHGSVRTAVRADRPRAPGRAPTWASPASTTSSPTSSRATSSEWVGYYEDVLGFDQLTHFDDDADLHRVLGAHVDGRVEPRQGRAADQRAGRGPPQEPDRGVPRLLRLARRAAHRPAHPRHRRRGAGPARPGRALHGRARPSTTTRPATRLDGRRAAVGGPGRARHPRRPRPRGLPAADLHRDAHRPARPCSSRSSSARAPRASARATSRPCSSPSSAPRPAAATSEHVKLARYRSARDGSIWVGLVTEELITPVADGTGRGGQGRLIAIASNRPKVPPALAEPEPIDRVQLLAPVPEPPSIRDFYAFEAHVATARRSRGLEMEPDWYELPVFYFTNPGAVLGPGEVVRTPAGHAGAGLRARGGGGDRAGLRGRRRRTTGSPWSRGSRS